MDNEYYAAGTRADSQGRHLSWFSGPWLYAHTTLPVGARVLDVGSGQAPHPAADVILDKFLEDNEHRPGKAGFDAEGEIIVTQDDGSKTTVTLHRPVVQGDVIALPFKDKSFDFVIAKDVLEHIPDIARACRELSRVAKAGYVEMPKLQSEMLWPQGDIHKWVVREEKEGLRAYSLEGFRSPWGQLMHEQVRTVPAMARAWGQSRHYLHLCFLWTDKLDIQPNGHVYDILT